MHEARYPQLALWATNIPLAAPTDSQNTDKDLGRVVHPPTDAGGTDMRLIVAGPDSRKGTEKI